MINNYIFNRSFILKKKAKVNFKLLQDNILLKVASSRMQDRLNDLDATFNKVLNIGYFANNFSKKFLKKTDKIIYCDNAYNMLGNLRGANVVADEESLPFSDNVFDLIVNIFTIHCVNNLTNVLLKIFNMLKSGGVVLITFFGPRTLRELVKCCFDADMKIYNGVMPHFFPFMDVRDAGNLMFNVGYKKVCADSDTVSIFYSTLYSLFNDIRSAGLSNSLQNRNNALTPKNFFYYLEEYYKKYFHSTDGYCATYEFVTVIGFKP